GLGLTLLVTLALVDGNLTRQLTSAIPDRAPSFFFVDIQRDEAAPFSRHLAGLAPDGHLETVPMLRGRIVSLAGVPVEQVEVEPQFRWALRGDRGITYAATPPEGTTLVEGAWWPPDHDGEPLLSFDKELADAFGVTIGDEVVVNVLGRRI